MSQRVRTIQGRHLLAAGLFMGFLGGLLALGAGNASAAEKSPSGAKEKSGAVAGRCVAVAGALLQREEADKAWKLVKPKETIAAGELLLALPGSKAEIEATEGGGRLILAGNLPDLALIPLLESAVVLRRPSKDFDFDFTLDRGRVIVANKSKKGTVRARARFLDQTWDLVLKKPGTEIAVEIFARWVDRPSSVEKPKKTDRPDATAILVVLKGEGSIQADASEYLLKAPPGPALFTWRSGQGTMGPTRLKELPLWAKPEAVKSTHAKAALARVDKLGKILEKSSVSAGLAEALLSKDSLTRVLAVYCLGASDDLPAVLEALENKKQRDVRLAAIDELRHWLGRDTDQMPILFQTLREKTFSPAHARIAIHLLQPFSERQRARPETYALLIDYLKHDRLAIRELANWHLIRLAPEEGRKVIYDPAAAAEKLENAYAKWKKELPDGQLPRKPKPRPIKKEKD